MVGGISHVVYAALIFIGIHLLSSTPVRATVIKSVGERAWLGLFSLAAALSLGWLLWAYGAAPREALWSAPDWARLLPWATMPLAFVLVVTGLATPNPAAAMGEKALEARDPAPGILKITRHPMMWGIALWALSHLPANGDKASVTLFGSFAFLALIGMRFIDRKKEEALGAAWGPFALTTSAIPFVAAIQGRAKIAWGEIGLWKVALGLAVYAAFAWFHAFFIGVSALPG